MGALMYISRSLVVSIQFLFLSLRLYPSIPCSLSRLSRLSHHRRCCCLSHRIWHISPSLTSSTRLYYSSPSRLLSLYASLLLQNCCPDSRLETRGRPLTTSTVLVHILPSTSRTSAVPATRGIYPLLACTILPSFPASRSRPPLTFTLSRPCTHCLYVSRLDRDLVTTGHLLPSSYHTTAGSPRSLLIFLYRS